MSQCSLSNDLDGLVGHIEFFERFGAIESARSRPNSSVNPGPSVRRADGPLTGLGGDSRCRPRRVVRDGRLTGRLPRRHAVEAKASAIELSINAR